MVTTDLAAVFMAQAPAQAEAVFTARAIRVTKVVIISNLAKVISSNSSSSPGIRVTENSCTVGSTTYLPLVCARGTRNFIRGL